MCCKQTGNSLFLTGQFQRFFSSSDIWRTHVSNEQSLRAVSVRSPDLPRHHARLPASQQPRCARPLQRHVGERRIRPGSQPAALRIPQYCCEYLTVNTARAATLLCRVEAVQTSLLWCSLACLIYKYHDFLLILSTLYIE